MGRVDSIGYWRRTELRQASIDVQRPRNICNILKRVETGALVLLDELVVGTDPGQGAALAQAIQVVGKSGCAGRRHHALRNLKVLPYTDTFPKWSHGS